MTKNEYQNGNHVIAVIGAGHGGLAMAGHLAVLGYSVHLCDKDEQKINEVKLKGGIQLRGVVNGFGKIALATPSVEDAISGVELIMVVVSSLAHKEVAKSVAPYLKDGQIIVLHPGRTFGAFEFKQLLIQQNVIADVIIAEAQTFIYNSRTIGPGQSQIFEIRHSVPVACVRAHFIPIVLKKLRQFYPQFILGENIFKTSFENVESIFNPAISILNAGSVENENDVSFYGKGVNASVARVLDSIDVERIMVAKALGVNVIGARQWLYMTYGIEGLTLLETMHQIPGNDEVVGLESLRMQYIEEDISCSLVPMASIGKMFGVPTPTMDSLIQLASLLNCKNYNNVGRTVDRIGLSGMNFWELRDFAIGERRILSKVI